MPNRSDAPGLQWRKRAGGKRRAYWVARPDLVKAGYRPKTVPLIFEEDDPRLEQRCKVLQGEMLEWSRGTARRSAFDGSLRSLVAAAETDPDSFYRQLKTETQRGYSKHMRLLMVKVGDRRVVAVTAADVLRWYRNIAGPDGAHTGYAYLTMSILKSYVSYGVTRRLAGCKDLREGLSAARFKQSGKRKERLTYAQVIAFRDAAHALGKPSMALGVLLQFELALRQRDVIGEWIDRTWRNGLTWSHIDAAGVLRKVTTKTAAEAAHRIADYPELAAELSAIPADRRVGPLVINEYSGLPYVGEQYRAWFRRIARRAGIPDSVWSMDARAGAITEAYESGASLTATMSMATHTQAATSRGYNRDGLEQSSSAARLRVEGRTDSKRR